MSIAPTPDKLSMNQTRIIGNFNASNYNSDVVSGQTGQTKYYWAVECHLPQGATYFGVDWFGGLKLSLTQADSNIAQAISIQTWLEYPSGVFTEVTYNNGGSVGTLNPGAQLTSDVVPVFVPATGQTMIPRLHVYLPSQLTTDEIPSNYRTLALTIVSQLVANEGGTSTISSVPFDVANSLFTKVFLPRAVIGRPAVQGVRSVAYFGDSIAGGARDAANGWAGIPSGNFALTGIFARVLAGAVPFAQSAVSGSLSVELQGPNSSWRLAEWADVVIYEPGINDISNNGTFATLQAACLEAQEKALAAGAKFVACTIVPPSNNNGTLIKPYVTGTGFAQSLDGAAAVLAITSYNAWLRSSGIQIIDINAVIDPNGTNFWPVVSPLYSGTGNVTTVGSSSVITDTGSPGWTAGQWNTPPDGLGPYMVWFPATNATFPVWSNTSNSVTVTGTVGQYPSAPAGTGLAYEILDLWTWEGVHPMPRVISRIGLAMKQAIGGLLGWK